MHRGRNRNFTKNSSLIKTIFIEACKSYQLLNESIMKKIWMVALMMIQLPLFAQKNYKEALKMAQAKIAESKFDEAIPLLDKAIQSKPKIAEIHFLKGYCLLRQDKNTDAIPILDQAIKLDAKKWHYYKRRGDALYNTMQYEKSLPDYTKAIDLETSKKNDTLFQYRADAYLKLDKYQEAINDYDKAIALNSKNGQMYFDRGYMYAKLNNKEKGCPDYQKAYEMGIMKAEKEAFELMQCDWAKPKIKPKDDSPVSIDKIEVDAFTGAVFTSKKLSYEKFEIVSKAGGFITSSVFAPDDEFIIKIETPKGFNLDGTDAHVGIGFGVYEGTKLLGEIDDLFKDGGALDAESLTSLKITLSMPKELEVKKIYILKVRFFDKLSNGEILVDMPFMVAQNTSKSTSINVSTGTLASEAITKSTSEISINKLDFMLAGKAVKTPLKGNQNYILSLSEKKSIGNEFNYRYTFISTTTGERISSDSKNAVLAVAKGLKIEIPLKTPPKGSYVLWLEIKDSKNDSKIWTMAYSLDVE